MIFIVLLLDAESSVLIGFNQLLAYVNTILYLSHAYT